MPRCFHNFCPRSPLDQSVVEESSGTSTLSQDTIHPFPDFNGRVTRLWLRDILRRACLPQVELAATRESERNNYFASLEAADRLDWQPLSAIWQRRFEQLPPPVTSP